MPKTAKKKTVIGCWSVVDEDDKFIKAFLSEEDPAKPSFNFDPPTVDEENLVESQLNAHLNPYLVETFVGIEIAKVSPKLQDKPFEDIDEYLHCNEE